MQTEARVGGVVVDGGGRASVAARRPQEQQQQRHIGTAAHLAAGGLAGAFSKTCTAPLARLTILFQVAGMHSDAAALRKCGIWHEASRIVREEGFGAFWKGNLVTIVHRLPYSAISFYSYERYKKFLRMVPGLDDPNYAGVVNLLGGGLAGVTAASVTYPLDVVRTRLATQKTTAYYKGIFHTLSTICKEETAKGLYKGLGATLLGVGPGIAISFYVYESLRSHWQMERPNDSNAMVSLFSGSLSGIAASTATFPLDLVKRRMQLHGAAGAAASIEKSSIAGTIRQILQKEGPRGFYRGIVPEYLKVVPSVGIAFMTYEVLKGLLSSIDEDDEN